MKKCILSACWLLLCVPFSSGTLLVGQQWKAPTTMKKLANGLTVVVSEDHSAPTFGICVSYGIGFRLEPEGRTGFAHLFEHLMFEGTPNAPKGVLDRVIEGGGGTNDGDTRYDFTEYVETAPISAIDPVLWIEADRMKTLDFSTRNLDNQRNVVEEEVRVNVLNQPYGLFFAIDLPGKAFDTYPNAHNFYGEFKDLDAARIEDVQRFYEQYYTPGNAVLVIVGDVKPEDVYAKVEQYFARIPSRQAPPKAQVEEPAQTAERRSSETDRLAKVPALAIAISHAATSLSGCYRRRGCRRTASQWTGFAAIPVIGERQPSRAISRGRSELALGHPFRVQRPHVNDLIYRLPTEC